MKKILLSINLIFLIINSLSAQEWPYPWAPPRFLEYYNEPENPTFTNEYLINTKTIDWVDFDNDGDKDIIGLSNISGQNSEFQGDLTVSINDGSNNFSTIFSKRFYDLRKLAYSDDYTTVDLDNDGDLDFVFHGAENLGDAIKPHILINNGNIFSSVMLEDIGYLASVIDFDNDGDLDVIDYSNKVFENVGDFEFQEVDNPWPWISDELIKSIKQIDIERDNILEHIGIYGGTVSIYSDSETEILINNYSGVELTMDLTNDGYVDFIMREESNYKLLVNNHDRTFTEYSLNCFNENIAYYYYHPDYPSITDYRYSAKFIPESGKFRATDIDNDGDVDLIVKGGIWTMNGSTELLHHKDMIYINNGDYTYNGKPIHDENPDYSPLFNDYDNDGDLDIVEFNKIFTNNTPPINTRPIAPSNLEMKYSQENSGVVLSWGSGQDNETPNEALTYNVYLGTSSNDAEVLSSEANVVTGQFLKARGGNCLYNTSKLIAKLKPGTYFWGVQSIDNGLASSEFTTSTFEIPFGPINTPSNLQANSVSSTQIDLTWVDESNNEEEFIIERSLTSGSGYVELARVGISETIYSDTDLNEGVIYYYRIKASNEQESSGYTEEVSNGTFLETPSNLLVNSTLSTISISWEDNTTLEDFYSVERSKNSGEGFIEIALLPANSTEFIDSGIDETDTYYYRIRAKNSIVNSLFSNEVYSQLLPINPSGLNVEPISNHDINITWIDNSTNEMSFNLERSIDDNSNYFEIATLDASTSNFLDSDVSDNHIYFYRVKASNVGGSSIYSNVENAITLPNRPTELAAFVVDDTHINLTWLDNASQEIGYKIERSENTPSNYITIATLGTDINSFSDSGLNSETTYYYRVYAFNIGPSEYSEEAIGSTLCSIPDQPTTASSSRHFTDVSDTEITMSWDVNGDGYKRIVTVREYGSDINYPVDGTIYSANSNYSSGDHLGNGQYVVYNGIGSSVTVTGLSQATRYTFNVFEYNQNNNCVTVTNYRNGSLGGSPTTKCTIPERPDLKSGPTMNFSNVTDNQMTVSWSTSGNGAKRIVVAREDGTTYDTPDSGEIYAPNSIFGNGDQLDGNQFVVYNGTGNSVTVTGLQPDTRYRFNVFEYNQDNSCMTKTNYFNQSLGGTKLSSCSSPSAPSNEGNSLSIGPISKYGCAVNWNIGTGDKRIIIVNEGQATPILPVDGDSWPDIDTEYTNGINIGNGRFIVYNGSGGGTFSLIGLKPETSYTLTILEYNYDNSCISTTNYKQAAYLSQSFTTIGGITKHDPTLNKAEVSDPCLSAKMEYQEQMNSTNAIEGKLLRVPTCDLSIVSGINKLIKVNYSSQTTAKSEIHVYDMTGKKVKYVDNCTETQTEVTMDFSNLPDYSILIVQVVNEFESKSVKVMLSR